MQKRYLSILVENNEGVLARISSLFCQRGFNIASLTVSETNDAKISRITVCVSGEENDIKQIKRQTRKLYEVKSVFELDEGQSVMRELLLIKVRADAKARGELREIAEVYKAKISDLSADSMILETVGESSKIDSFIKILSSFDIIEICRTGVTAMLRGSDASI